MKSITTAFDEWALKTFRAYSDDKLVELNKLFTNLSDVQSEMHDPVASDGSKALLELVRVVQSERLR